MAHRFRTRRPPVLAGGLAVLLGVGFVPAVAPSATATNSGHLTHTTLHGFRTAATTVALGGKVVDSVSVRPRAHRLVRVQARRPGGPTFVTVSSGFSSKAGTFRAVYHPTTAGTWRFRLLLPATKTATRLVSVARAVTATGDTKAPGPVTGLTVTPGTDSALTLSWSNPDDADFAGVVIRRAVGATAPAPPPAGD